MLQEKNIIIPDPGSITADIGFSNEVSIISGESLRFNGEFADKTLQVVPILSKLGCTTNLALQSLPGDDLSNVTFTITGKQNNIEITESIAGPTSGGITYNSVFSDNYYDEIISIIPNNNSPYKINVGIGTKVYVLCSINGLSSEFLQYKLSLCSTEGQECFSDLTIYHSLNELNTLPYTYEDIKNNTGYLHVLDSASASAINYILPEEHMIVTKNILCNFTLVQALGAQKLVFNFIQI